MHPKHVIVIIASIALIVLLIFSILPYFMPGQKLETRSVYINGKEISVEIADTFEKRIRGLMGHEPLGENEGMLFIFDSEGYYGIWMPNMSFAIDIVWIDRNFSVVHIEKNVLPCESMPCKSYASGKPAVYVLELAANSTSDLEIGDKMNMSKALQ